MLAKSKLNSIDTLISQTLIDMDISHEEFITILKEKDRYEMMKDNLRDKNGESMKLWDLIVWNQRFRKYFIEYFVLINYFFLVHI